MPSDGNASRISAAARKRTQRVVLVQHRNAEHGHHRVADEFLHRSAVAFDNCLHPFEVACEDAAQRFGVDRFTE